MKPIELTISGLNSFRQEQRIDFEALCADGLFGIFGPTGSGKSTILDGMTLALYGTVERAANNTSGILNQLEQQLSVGFTFELSGDCTVRYRAERSYKRMKDGGLRQASCRLIKLGKVKEVLADKERDLTQSIRKILGLTHDDFTRAVVLPQGKFAEFLTLKGNERRKMLQRLFHLEKYGDELSARLKRAAEGRKQRLQVIVEKQAVLGDASREAVKAAEDRCAQIANEQKRILEELEHIETQKAHFEDVRSLIDEKDNKTRKLEQLKQEKDHYHTIKRELESDEAADRLVPYLEALVDAERETTEAKRLMAEVSGRYEQTKAAVQATEMQHAQAKRALDDQLPKHERDRQRLLEGASVQKQLQEEISTVKILKRKRSELKQKIDRARLAVQQQQTQCAQLKEILESNEEKRMALTVDSERRLRVQHALQEKKEIDSLDLYLEEKRSEWIGLRDRLRKLSEQQDQLKHEQKQAEQKAAVLNEQNQSLYNRSVHLSRLIRSARAFIEYERNKMEQEREKIHRQNLSRQLMDTLRDGQPCPVCGALHHPHPAPNQVISEAPFEKRRLAFDKAAEQLNQAQQHIGIYRAQLEQQAKVLTASFVQSDALNQGLREDEPADFVKWEQDGVDACVNPIEVAVRELKQDLIHLDQATAAFQNKQLKQETLQSTCAAQFTMYQEKMRLLKAQASEKSALRDQLWSKWSAQYASSEQMQAEEQEIASSDKQSEQLRKEISQLKDQLKPLERMLEKNLQTLHALESKWSESSGRMEAAEKALQGRRSQLKNLQLSEEMPLEQLALDLEQDIKRIKQAFETSSRAAEHAREAYHLADKNAANAKSRFERAEQIHHEKLHKWSNHLEASQFDAREAVMNAHLTDEERMRRTNEWETYVAQSRKLVSEIDALSERIGGQDVSKEQLNAIRQKWTERKEKGQEVSQALGAANKEKETLIKNHALFRTLESERKRNQKELDQFEKLQRVFRGNTFVEFVAEEQLQQVCAAASKRLGELTHDRYVLEVDEQSGFIIRDNGNGGVYRPVSSLSGGETFLTSLALALSLSEQIQLRGNVPLQFFFLDEGFGSLDPDLLDTVVTALEKLHMRRLAIGVISHVPEMRERLPRRLVVSPAIPSGRGSRVHMEML
ncbi:AAA family ATPase [Sporolactobacillus terrae]|uniref:AAA family ATPase n=1 Tax=Sporolactobacillus terrae TaxID=269673 RepID=UPI00111AA9D4|nr:AAA family ATPase [Sporolactobacillus terrae]